jgi:hypothetical protein
MISPESGIHRPSNNGAPAIQTLGFTTPKRKAPIALLANTRPTNVLRSNVRGCDLPRRSKRFE